MCFNCGAVHNLSEVGEQWAVNGLQALITELKTDHSESKIAVSEAPRPDESNSARGQDTRRKRPRRSEQHTWSCCLLWNVLEKQNQHQNLKASQTHIFSTLLDFTPREHSVAITFYNFTRFKSHKSLQSFSSCSRSSDVEEAELLNMVGGFGRVRRPKLHFDVHEYSSWGLKVNSRSAVLTKTLNFHSAHSCST